MDLLKRQLAPIIPEAWTEIEEEARRVLKLNLAGRKLVDFDGPHGWEFAAVNLGRLNFQKDQPAEDIHVGIRQVLPLIETRVPFFLNQMELDTVARGATDADLDPVVEAAQKIAKFEDTVIFKGYRDGNVQGILESSPHQPLKIPADHRKYPHLVVEATEVLRTEGVDGPYAMALGPQAYNNLAQAADDGYPISAHLQRIIDGPVVRVPALEGAVVLSVRGGDYLLTVGQDLSIGYTECDRDQVELYLTCSFTFRVLEPAAAVRLTEEQ